MTTDFPSRELLRQQLMSAGRETKSGAAFLVHGGPQSGKSALIEMLHAHRDRRSRLPIWLSAHGGYMKMHASGLLDDIADLSPIFGSAASIAAKLIALVGSVDLGISKVAAPGFKASGAVAKRISERHDRVFSLPGRVLDRLREFDFPLLILVDDLHKLDQVEWWWQELFGPLLGDIRAGQDHLLVATTDGLPFQPASMQRKQESGLRISELPPLNSDDIEILTGPIDEHLARSLVEYSHGQLGPVVVLWANLRRVRLVQQEDGRWMANTGHPEIADLLMDEFRRTMRELGYVEDVVSVVEGALRLALECGASFTADAVAEVACPNFELVSVLRKLSTASAGTPLLYEMDSIVLNSGHQLTVFEFSERLRSALILLSAEEEISPQAIWTLGMTLMQLYGPLKWLAAGEAMRLFRRVGDLDQFEIAGTSSNRLEHHDLRNQLDRLLDSEVDGADAGDAHAMALEILIELESQLEMEEVLEYEERMVTLASASHEEEVRLDAMASFASALANARKDPESQRRAQQLAEEILDAEVASSTARLAALFTLGHVGEVAKDWLAMLEAYRAMESFAREQHHDEAIAQAMARQASAYLFLAVSEDEPGKYDREVGALHIQFAGFAGADNRGNRHVLEQKLEMALRREDRGESRKVVEELALLYAKLQRPYEATLVSLRQSERESEWLRHEPPRESDQTYLQESLRFTTSLAMDVEDESGTSWIFAKLQSLRADGQQDSAE